MAYGRAGMLLPAWANHVNDALRTGSLNETERTMLSNAQRQRVVDFFNTLPQVAERGYIKAVGNPDCGFGRAYIRRHMNLASRYSEELHETDGLAFTEKELNAVLGAWATLCENPSLQ